MEKELSPCGVFADFVHAHMKAAPGSKSTADILAEKRR